MTNFKLFYVLLLFIGSNLMSFQLPKNIKKKVDKEVKQLFSVEEYLMEPILVSDEMNVKLKTKIHKDNLFEIKIDSTQLGYAYIGKVFGKVDYFDYLVVFDKDLIIVKAKILVYREDYGGEIGSKRWLKQFIGKTKEDKLIYKKDIIAISGATISANAMTVAVNNLLETITVLHQNKVI